jgi:hypothetical protein
MSYARFNRKRSRDIYMGGLRRYANLLGIPTSEFRVITKLLILLDEFYNYKSRVHFGAVEFISQKV